MDTYIKPAAALKKLEAAKMTKQNDYIYGATGFGKTELVSNFCKTTNTYTFPALKTAATCLSFPKTTNAPGKLRCRRSA